jgi:hypothetical protein
MPFLVVDTVYGPFPANGVFGLAPTNDERAYINQLWS